MVKARPHARSSVPESHARQHNHVRDWRLPDDAGAELHLSRRSRAEDAAEVLLAREYQALADEVRKRLDDDASEMVREAYILAERCHTGQVRKSGDPYLVHPLRVSRMLASLGLDAASVVAGRSQYASEFPGAATTP